jgi:Lsr2
MAQNVIIELEDDLDGGPADETLTFALDGRDYEIDLSAANAQKLREALHPYATAGRKAPAGNGRRRHTPGTTTSSSKTATIRAWAKDHGHQVSDRGRIHQSVKDVYYASTGQS